MWGRVPQFRIIYHPNDTIALGLSLENPEQYIGVSAGGSLVTLPSGLASAYPELRWPETPYEAANWLLKAWNDAEKVAESVQDQRLKELSTRSEKTDLQARVLRVTNKYDPKMAEKFIKQLAAKESGIRKDRAAFDDRSSRSEQLLRMAVQAVDTAPDLAFNLAVNSLADGISQSLQDAFC